MISLRWRLVGEAPLLPVIRIVQENQSMTLRSIVQNGPQRTIWQEKLEEVGLSISQMPVAADLRVIASPGTLTGSMPIH